MSDTPWRDDPNYGGMTDAAARPSWEEAQRRKAKVIQHPNQKAPPESEGKEPRFKFRLLRDMRAEPPKKDWLIKGIFAPGETSAWIAPPGKLKSALIGEASFAIASNLADWHGYKVKKSGAVIYFALERVSLVERRLVAYQARASEESDDPPIAVVPGIFDLMDPSIVDHVLAVIRDVEKAVGCPVVMIVLDTFAKTIAAGGGDEDKAKDQGKVFANIQRIKDALGAKAPHVAIIGHTGKDETRGSRGSNAILGDVDLMVTITGDGAIKTATSIKSNDGEERPLFSFKPELVEDGVDEDGEPTTINIVSQDDVSTQDALSKSKSGGWTKGLHLVRTVVLEAIRDRGIDHRVRQTGPLVKAVPLDVPRGIHKNRYVGSGDGDRDEAERKAWRRNIKAAQENGLISGEMYDGQELIWLSSTKP